MIKRLALYVGDATLKAAIGSIALVIVMETIHVGQIACAILKRRT